MSMDIYAKPNTKVYFLDENGDVGECDAARQFMQKGDVFTVKEIEVGSWSSRVFFNEMPTRAFNTVMFEILEEGPAFRKLATIRKVADVEPIPGADSIECLTVDGWKLVSGKDNFKVGDLCIYFEVDSFLPVREEFEFLRKNGFKSTKNLGDGFRLKTIKLRGQVSQGLALPLADFFSEDKKGWYYLNDSLEPIYIEEGSDVTEYLGVKKYEKPIPANMMGRAKGNFPSFIHKTDQERLQNCFGGVSKWIYKEKSSEYMDELPFVVFGDDGNYHHIKEAKGGIVLDNGVAFFPKETGWVRTSYKDNAPEIVAERELFEATIKLDGSSMTVYHFNGTTGVCSRNFDLAEDDENNYWKCAKQYDMIDYVKSISRNIALQGEIYGEGVQENHDKLKGLHFFLFDIFDIDQGRYMTPTERREFLDTYIPKFEEVPIVNEYFTFSDFKSVADFVDYVNAQKSINNPVAEGVVFKSHIPQGPTFKVISSKFLLKEKD